LLGESTIDAAKNVKRVGRSLEKVLPGIRVLQDVSLEQLEEYRGLLSEVAYKRAHHVIAENARVLDGMEALRMGSFVCTSSANIWPNHTGACATYLK
jgi:galactokinase